MATGPYRPATRWCFPPVFTVVEAQRERSLSPWPLERSAAALPTPLRDTGDVLRQLLARHLERGEWRMAIRRFLMLRSLGCQLPRAQRERCENHLRHCPPRDLRRMEAAVRDWVALTAGTQADAEPSPREKATSVSRNSMHSGDR